MAEPTSSTAVGIAAGAGLSLSTAFLGAQIDALIVGLVAAVFMSIWLPTIDDRVKSFSAVLMSSLLAGYLSPILPPYIVSTVPSLAPAHDNLRLALALLFGGAGPTIVPIALDRVKVWTGKQG